MPVKEGGVTGGSREVKREMGRTRKEGAWKGVGLPLALGRERSLG